MVTSVAPGARQRAGTILVVCTGNVCRSPYLEHLLRDGLDRAWGPGRIVVRSAGTRGLTGQPMTPQSAEQLGELAHTAQNFRARRLCASDVASADLVLAVTREHRAAALQMSPVALRRTVTPVEVALAAEHLPLASPEVTDVSRWLRALAAATVSQRPAIAVRPAAELDLIDPYGGPARGYRAMRHTVQGYWPTLLRALSPQPSVAPGAPGPVD